jgi:tetratricopeptide (TPR) repeat protein
MSVNRASAGKKSFLFERALTLLLLLSLCVSAATMPPVRSKAKSQKKTSPRKTSPKKTPAKKKPTKQSAKQPRPAPPKETPADALNRARDAATQQERIAMLEKFLVAHRLSPEAAEARELLVREYALRAEQFLREGNPQRATRDFKAAFRLVPEPITDRWFGQFIFPMPVAMNAFGFRAESVALMRSFESRFARDANRLIQIGFFYIQIEAPLEAVRVLEGVVKTSADDHRAHNALGTAYLINLRLDEAASEFERAIELNPRDEFANLNMANLARAAGDHQRALRYYQQQMAVKDDDAEARAGMVISLLALGRDEEAEVEMRRAFELAPQDYRFPAQLAYYYTARKKLELARPLVERAARIAPRYAWAHIVKSNIDAMEGKYGDALSTIIAAQTLGSFPTLNFELVKALMLVDGYDQALEVMGNAFSMTEEGEFSTMLGGVLPARSLRLDLLLERERQASLFLSEHPTTALQYRLAESLGRIDHYLKAAARERDALTKKPRRAEGEESQSSSRPRRVAPPVEGELSAGSDAGLASAQALMEAVTTFTTLDDGRQPFRMVWAARRLTDSGVALDAAVQLARRAIALADSATEPDGAMRDAPLLDRQGRRAVFLGRAYDALGWALFKKGEIRGALVNLTKSVDIYPDNPERKGAMWHLAVAMEEAGDQQRALDLYIASYEPETPTSSSRKAQIESLYKKLNGSLTGLEDKLKKP